MNRLILLDQSFSEPAGTLAFEEALLDFAEETEAPGFLRFWESPVPFVVLGYGKKAELEVHLETAAQLDIPVMRRCSGGGTVLQGPGCFNYALVLPVSMHSALETITGSNRFIMDRQKQAVQKVVDPESTIEVQGHTDLTCNGLKFSGNAQRRKRTHLLFHGSFLLKFDLHLVEKVLKMPIQQPEYRQQRSHREFIRNLAVPTEPLKRALCEVWNAEAQPFAEQLSLEMLQEPVEKLIAEKYGRSEWNLK